MKEIEEMEEEIEGQSERNMEKMLKGGELIEEERRWK